MLVTLSIPLSGVENSSARTSIDPGESNATFAQPAMIETKHYRKTDDIVDRGLICIKRGMMRLFCILIPPATRRDHDRQGTAVRGQLSSGRFHGPSRRWAQCFSRPRPKTVHCHRRVGHPLSSHTGSNRSSSNPCAYETQPVEHRFPV